MIDDQEHKIATKALWTQSKSSELQNQTMAVIEARIMIMNSTRENKFRERRLGSSDREGDGEGDLTLHDVSKLVRVGVSR